jgi:transcriptional regulator with XRE-family HTH domain
MPGTKTIRDAILAIYNEQNELYGLTQAELARRTGLSQPMIGMILRGKRLFTEKNILPICRALGVRWRDLDIMIEPPDYPKKLITKEERRLCDRLHELIKQGRDIEHIKMAIDLTERAAVPKRNPRDKPKAAGA